MSTIVTRAGKGSPLTHTEVDNNFTNLNTDKLESGSTASSLAISSADINGGTIDGTAIGSSSASTGAFTTLSASGAFSANGGATLGDASGDALTINSSAVSIPNGLNFDSNTFVIDATNNRVGVGNAAPAHTVDIQSASGGTTARLRNTTGNFIDFIETSGSSRTGYIGTTNGTNFVIHNDKAGQMQFDTNNLERMRIDSAGNVGIGTSSPSYALDVNGVIKGNNLLALQAGTPSFPASGLGWEIYNNSSTDNFLQSYNRTGSVYINSVYNALSHQFRISGTERMRLDSSGRLGIGTTSPTSGYLLDVAGGIKLSGAFDENVFAVSGTTPALSPSNGTIQTWTLSGNSTPTAGTWNDGESMTLMVLDGTAYTITWTSVAVTWVGGSAPTLDTTKQNVIELWKVGGVIYGALVGAA